MKLWVALLLAVIHACAGLALLMVSSWFIAASALAGAGFNYMIPAVVIRALAFIRIASGYGQMWLGHDQLLKRVKAVRLRLFRRLAEHRFTQRAMGTEALAQHSEAIAALWIAWIAQNAGAIVMLMLAQITVSIWLPDLGIYFWLLLCVYGAIMIYLIITALRASRQLFAQQHAFRAASDGVLNSAAIWHQQARIDLPHGDAITQHQHRLQSLGRRGLWFLQLVAMGLLISVLLTQQGQVGGQATFLILIMLLLSARDWLAPALESQPALAAYTHGKRAFQALPVAPVTTLTDFTEINALSVHDFQASDRALKPINLALSDNGIQLIKGGSGSGKSSLLQALCGLLPYQGQRRINGKITAAGHVPLLYYAEQAPSCLKGSLRQNVLIASSDTSDEMLKQALDKVGLAHLSDNLDQWIGENGRQLSGGERKRLNLARACLYDAPVWLLDEPFEGLDAQHIERLTQLLNHEGKHRLIVIASHIQPDSLIIEQQLNLDAGQ